MPQWRVLIVPKDIKTNLAKPRHRLLENYVKLDWKIFETLYKASNDPSHCLFDLVVTKPPGFKLRSPGPVI